MRPAVAIIFGILLSVSSVTVFAATNYSSTNFTVSNPVIDELGGYSSSTSFRLIGDIPYISPARSTSTSYGNNPGFPGFPSPSSTASSTSGSSSAAFSGGGGPPPGPPKPKPKPTEEIFKRVDFNRDGRVDFIDFSILLYYFDKEGDIIVPFDLNDDGIVDVVDLSIFLYYWDGN